LFFSEAEGRAYPGSPIAQQLATSHNVAKPAGAKQAKACLDTILPSDHPLIVPLLLEWPFLFNASGLEDLFFSEAEGRAYPGSPIAQQLATNHNVAKPKGAKQAKACLDTILPSYGPFQPINKKATQWVAFLFLT